MLSSRHVVILKEADRDRYLPIWIGPWEASAIAMKLQGLTPERPLTHDLFATTLEELGVQVDRVVISELAEETFHARILFERDGRTVEVDARPSDALALAVRTGVRIFATVAVLDQAALGADGGLGDEGEERLDRSRRSASGVVDPRLDVFRDFVNSLDVGPGRAARAAASWTGSEPPMPLEAESAEDRAAALGARAAGSPRHPEAQPPEVADGAQDDLRLGARSPSRPSAGSAGTPDLDDRRPAACSLISSSAEKNAPPDSTRSPSRASRRNSLQAQSTSVTRRPKKIRLARR